MRSAVAKEMEKLALQTTKYYKKILLYTQRVGVVCDVCTSQPHLASPPHHTPFIALPIVRGFRPESENFDSSKKGYHLKGHLKRSRMVQILAP